MQPSLIRQIRNLISSETDLFKVMQILGVRNDIEMISLFQNTVTCYYPYSQCFAIFEVLLGKLSHLFLQYKHTHRKNKAAPYF